jgi:Uma2 family endonuclease
MTTTGKLITAEELFAMGDCYPNVELIDGQLRELPAADWTHGERMLAVGIMIGGYVRAQRLGEVAVGGTGIVLSRDPDTVRGADVAFISAERLPSDRPITGYSEIVPDFVVEVVPPGDRADEIEQKVAQWLEAGVRLVWVVYPATRHVVAYRELAHPRVYTDAETIDGEPVLPGFACAVAEIFA